MRESGPEVPAAAEAKGMCRMGAVVAEKQVSSVVRACYVVDFGGQILHCAVEDYLTGSVPAN